MNVRAVFIGVLVLGAVVGVGFWAAGSMSGSQSTAPAAFRVIAWDALVPPGWDPFERFRNTDMAALADDDPRVLEMMNALRVAWDNAPTAPGMDGESVKLPGYIVPLEEVQGRLKEFLLVPYFGACIHSPPPPANQIVHVVAKQPFKGLRTMDLVWVSGVLAVRRQDSPMGMSAYRLDAVATEPYEPSDK